MFEVPQHRVVLTTDCQEHDVGLPHSVLMVCHVHHVRKGLRCQFGVSAAHHHMEAAAQQADGQALGEVPGAQDGHRGPGRLCVSTLGAVGQETSLCVLEVVVRGRSCEEHRAPAAAHRGEGVHPASLSSSVVLCLGGFQWV